MATFFKNINYNHRSNKIRLSWHEDGVDKLTTHDYIHNFYVTKDGPQEENDKVDLFGRIMKKVSTEKKKDMPNINVKERAESDLGEPTKFLHDKFAGKELEPDMNNVQIMYYDIEVAIGHTPYSKKTLVRLEDGKDVPIVYIEQLPSHVQKRLKVYCPKVKDFVYYPVSSYAGKAGFPKPKASAFPVNAIAQYFTKENKLYLYADKPFKYVKEHKIDKRGNKVPKTYGSIDDMKNRLLQETGIMLSDIEYVVITDEKQLLEKFIGTMHKHKTDIISGWNTDIFDNPYVTNRLLNLKSKKSFSPTNSQHIQERENERIQCSYKGISSLDYMKLYKDKFTFDNKGYYSLDNIVGIELKKSKLSYDCSMKEFYQDYWDDFMLYNAIDTMLVAALDKKMGFMNLALMTSNTSLIPLESILGTVQSLTGVIKKTLNNKGVVLNDRDTANRKVGSFPGGVSECKPGLYHYGCSFDVASMYPHFLMQHNVSIETMEIHEASDLKDVVRINDVKNKKAYFFWPTDKLKVYRDGKLLNIQAKDIKSSDIVVLKPNANGVNFQGQPNWTHDIGMEKSILNKRIL